MAFFDKKNGTEKEEGKSAVKTVTESVQTKIGEFKVFKHGETIGIAFFRNRIEFPKADADRIIDAIRSVK